MLLAEAGLMGRCRRRDGLALACSCRAPLSSMNNMAGFSLTMSLGRGFVAGMVVAFVVSQLAALCRPAAPRDSG